MSYLVMIRKDHRWSQDRHLTGSFLFICKILIWINSTYNI